MEYFFDRIENIVEKGKNAGYKHFFPFSTMFSDSFFLTAQENTELSGLRVRAVFRRSLHDDSFVSQSNFCQISF